MDQRTLGRTARTVSVIGLGTWQLGADWGNVSELDARAVLDASHRAGVTFFDTADVYGDGRSETIIGAWRAGLSEAERGEITIATKMGRRLDQLPENYSAANFRAWTDRSRTNLGMD
ncbi:MAG: aldo/keto reductase, partial [Pseudolysinimonas sp.]